MSELILALELLTLLCAARAQWERVQADAAQAQREHVARCMADAFSRGVDDDHQCDVCHRVAPIREVIALHDDAALCCLACAEIIRPRGAPCA